MVHRSTSRIRLRRKELGWTQTEFAQRIGVESKSAVSRLENGKYSYTADQVQKYADVLGVTPAYLMGWNDNVNKVNTDSLVDAVMNDKCNELIEISVKLTDDNLDALIKYATFLLDSK